MINLIKSKPAIFLLIAIIAIALVITAIIELRRPTSQLPLAEVEIVDSFETNLSNLAISPGTINISTTLNSIENFKEEVSILTYDYFPITEDFVGNTSNTLGVTESGRFNLEGAGEIVDARNGFKNLNIYKDLGTLIYSDVLQPDPNVDYTFDSNVNIQEYRARSDEFLRSIGINVNKYRMASTQYLTYPGSEPTRIQNLTAAGLIEFTYVAETENIPVTDTPDNLDPNQISIWIDKNFVIRKAHVSAVGTTGNTTARLRAKTLDELKTSISKGEATLVNSSFGLDTKILYTAVESAELMYYASGDRLLPVYVISAKLISETGEEGTGKLILKAF